jgi:hypothetical protein
LFWSGSTEALQPVFDFGLSWAICFVTRSMSALAWASETSGFIRPITRSQWKSWFT